MSSDYEFSEEARLDMHDIWDYIAEDSLDAADKVRDAIHTAVLKLVDMPEIGHVREDIEDTSLRFWRVHSYVIVYRPGTKPLQIVRVLSGFRDMSRLL